MKFINVELVKGELAPLDFRAKQKYSPHILSYFRYYGLGLDVTHHFGTFQSQDFTLAAHVFTPEKARGAVFLLHGYYDHSGIHKNIIRLCIEKQFAVAVFDLPGHLDPFGIRSKRNRAPRIRFVLHAKKIHAGKRFFQDPPGKTIS